MSRPYLKINSATYSESGGDVVTLDITGYRLRGQSSFSLGGLSSSRTISLSSVGATYGNSTYTFSAELDTATNSGTSSTTYLAPTATIRFDGIATASTNVKLYVLGFGILGGTGPGGFTYSGGTGPNFASTLTCLQQLFGSMSFTGAALGFSATISGTNSIVFSAPSNTGAYYNASFNGAFSATASGAGLGTLGFTFSTGASFSGGYTNYALTLGTNDYGTLNTTSLRVS